MKQLLFNEQESISIVKEAGNLLLSFFNRPLKIYEKEGKGLVTQADIEVEQFLITSLRALFPQAGIIAEESGSSGADEYQWVIDPLDGTTNFAHGLPYFCISVALTLHNRPVLALVYNPLLQELFYASKGKGAFLNERPMQVPTASSRKKRMILLGLPLSLAKSEAKLFSKLPDISPRYYSFRSFGAAALDCANVAAGRIDAVFFRNLAWWDIAAGMLLIQEAQGSITDFQGNPMTRAAKTCVAAAPSLHKQLLSLWQ